RSAALIFDWGLPACGFAGCAAGVVEDAESWDAPHLPPRRPRSAAAPPPRRAKKAAPDNSMSAAAVIIFFFVRFMCVPSL
ncbi:MAG: hypothetical protein LBC67_04380, partial [Spirochaetales bacterium]|nr:hypothetical protein [Spirochaetales bacterium]